MAFRRFLALAPDVLDIALGQMLDADQEIARIADAAFPCDAGKPPESAAGSICAISHNAASASLSTAAWLCASSRAE